MRKQKRFGDRIKEIRLSTTPKTTLKQLSGELGINMTMLSDIENNRKNPFSQELMEKFAEYFDLNADVLAELYDLAAAEKNATPMDITEKIMFTEVGDYARMALRMSEEENTEDWKEFIRQLERKKRSND